MPIVDSLHPRPPYMPQAIPADLAPRLMRLHGHPFVWWIAQFVSYLFRLQPGLVADIEQIRQKLGFQHPVVGLVMAISLQRTYVELINWHELRQIFSLYMSQSYAHDDAGDNPGQATYGSTVSSIKCDRCWHLD